MVQRLLVLEDCGAETAGVCGDCGAETVVHGDCGAETVVHGDCGEETGVSTSPSIACIPLLIPYTSEPP